MTVNAYPWGKQIKLTATFTDDDGNAQDPDTVTFQWDDPNAERRTKTYVTDPEVVRLSTGVFRVIIGGDLPGLWEYRVESTGTGKDAEEGQFRVRQSVFR